MHVKRTRSIFTVQEYHLEAVQEKKIVWVFVNMKKIFGNIQNQMVAVNISFYCY